jgi:hypothetical protein
MNLLRCASGGTRVLDEKGGNPQRRENRSKSLIIPILGIKLIALAGSGSGAVQRELAQLEAAELVTVKRVGNQKHYQANASAPIFEELRGLVLKTSWSMCCDLHSHRWQRKLTRH